MTDLLELCGYLVIFVTTVIYFVKNYKRKPTLQKRKLRRLLKHFRPESLLPESEAYVSDTEDTLQLNDFECVDLVKKDFLGFAADEDIQRRSAQTIYVYGVGTSGPRSFFGTSDRHEVAEKKLVDFYGAEMSLIYSYGYVTTTSILNALITKQTLVFVDEDINDQIKSTLIYTKSTIYYYQHNNSKDLSRLLELIEQNKYDGVYLVVEAVFEKTGALCALPELLSVCRQHKVRIALDETYTIGTYGKRGRGILEYFNLSIRDVDIVCGSLEHAFGTVGGFSVGCIAAVENQQITSLSYVYSASLSVFLIENIIQGLDNVETRTGAVQRLCKEVHEFLTKFPNEFLVLSHSNSPRKVIQVRKKCLARTVVRRNRLTEIKREPAYMARLYDLVENIVAVCKEEYGVYMAYHEDYIYVHLGYDLSGNKEARKLLYEAIKRADGMIKLFD